MNALLTEINRQHTSELRKSAGRHRLARRARGGHGTGSAPDIDAETAGGAVKQARAAVTRRAPA